MPDPLVLYSTATYLAYGIAQEYYGNVHYAWCSPVFDGRTSDPLGPPIPPTSSPCEIYGNLHQEVIRRDRHSAKIIENKSGIIRGAAVKRRAGIISASAEREIRAAVGVAESFDFRPLLFVIPYSEVKKLIERVPVNKRAHPLSVECLIPFLPPNLSQRAFTEAVYQLLTLLRHRALLKRTSANNLLSTTRAKGAVPASPSFRRGLIDSVRQIEHAEGKSLDLISDAKLLKYRKTLDAMLFQKASPERVSERLSGQMVLRRLRSDYETRKSMGRNEAVPLLRKASSKGLESGVRSTSSGPLKERPLSQVVVASNRKARASKASSTGAEARAQEVVAGISKKRANLPTNAFKNRAVPSSVSKEQSTRREIPARSAATGSFKKTKSSKNREMALSNLKRSFRAKEKENVRSQDSLEAGAIARMAKKSAAA